MLVKSSSFFPPDFFFVTLSDSTLITWLTDTFIVTWTTYNVEKAKIVWDSKE